MVPVHTHAMFQCPTPGDGEGSQTMHSSPHTKIKLQLPQLIRSAYCRVQTHLPHSPFSPQPTAIPTEFTKIYSSNYTTINAKSRIIFLNVHIYIATILPVVVYGCEIWNLPMRQEHRLKVTGNRVLRGIYGMKWQELGGGHIIRSFITCAIFKV
jgi:hypothetical protein